MGSYFDQFNDVSLAAAERQARDDERDLNHERAGLETGRRSRFGVFNSAGPTDEENGKDKKKSALQTMLDLMLLNPNYAQAFAATNTLLLNAESDSETQIALAKSALTKSTVHLENLQSRAMQLPDGVRVYLDPQTGQVFTENGIVLDQEAAAKVEFSGNEPTYAEYLAARRTMDADQEHLNVWQEYQIVLGGYRNELLDTDSPPSRERLDEIADEIETRRPRANDIVGEINVKVDQFEHVSTFDKSQPKI